MVDSLTYAARISDNIPVQETLTEIKTMLLNDTYPELDLDTAGRFERLAGAMFDQSFPTNPIPFAQGLADFVREHGSDSIASDDAKKMLWVLIAQAYGQLGEVNLTTEYMRLGG